MSGPFERLRPPLHVDAINEVSAGEDSMMAMILRDEGDGCSHIVAQMLSDDDAHDICEIVNTSAGLHAQLTEATAESRRYKALADDHFRNAQQIAERLTAATRRAKQLEAEMKGHDLIPEGDHAKAIVRAEQAERMLAEVAATLDKDDLTLHDLYKLRLTIRSKPSRAKFKECDNCESAFCAVHKECVRSAASGEQG